VRPNLFSFTKSIVKILHLAAYSARKNTITYYLGRSVFRCHDDDDDDDDDDLTFIMIFYHNLWHLYENALPLDGMRHL